MRQANSGDGGGGGSRGQSGSWSAARTAQRQKNAARKASQLSRCRYESCGALLHGGLSECPACRRATSNNKSHGKAKATAATMLPGGRRDGGSKNGTDATTSTMPKNAAAAPAVGRIPIENSGRKEVAALPR